LYLSKSSGSLLPGRGLINPAFVIKIVPATDELQQKQTYSRENPTNDYLDNLKVGQRVEATKGKEKVVGKVERIIKNSQGDGIYVIIRDSSGKEHKIEGSNITALSSTDPGYDRERNVSSPGLFNETKFLSFNDFTSKI